MSAVIISILCLLWGVLLYYKRNISSLLFGLFLLPTSAIVTPVPVEIYTKRFTAIVLFALYIATIQKSIKYRRLKFPLKKSLIVMFVASLLLIVPDNRFTLTFRILYPFLDAIDTYYPLFLGFFFGYVYVKKYDRFLKPLIICCIIVEVYAVFNLVSGSNPVNEFISLANGSKFLDYARFNLGGGAGRERVSSLYRYSFDLGFNSCLMFLFFLSFYLIKRFNIFTVSALFLSILGVFLCGSRTVVLAFASGVVVFLWCLGKFTKKTNLYLTGALLLVVGYCVVPPIQNMVDTTIDTIILHKSEVSGSSTEMRGEQLDGALLFFSKNPIFGNGFKYIFLDLGWGSGNRIQGMAGYESIAYALLIERGLIGIIAFVIFFSSILIYFKKNLHYNKLYSSLGLGIIITFLVFALGTGALDAWLNTMVLSGMLIGFIEREKSYHKNKVTRRRIINDANSNLN